jgi:osmoprotectant transport system substrate-binding protein
MKKRRLYPLALLLVAALALAACGSSKKTSSSSTTAASGAGKGKPAVVLGTKNFPEEFILGQLYMQALQAKGFTVNLKNNIGSTEVIDTALTSGKIDMYPEYTGTIVQEVAKSNALPKSAQATYDQAKAFEEKRGFTLLAQTPFYDRDALAVKPAYAQQHGLSSISDLKKVGAFSFGAPPESKTRYQGLAGLQQLYGLKSITFVPLTIGLQYQALDSGKIQVADVFTTDGQLLGGKYKVLNDDKGLYGFQNVAPVVKKTVVSAEGPAFTQTLDSVSALLTLPAIQRMNAAVVLDKQDPAKVAAAFLAANHLK